MEFRVLGSLEVVDDGRALPLGGRKQRGVLAILLLNRGEAVTSDGIIDDLWGERAPPTARTAVQVYVSQLRKMLGDDVVVTRDGGYAVHLDGRSLDVDRFEQLVAKGRELLASGGAAAAAATLRDALDLWRGPPLADFAYEEFAQTEIGRLEELRLLALEERIDADLALGRHAALVPELEARVRAHPLRERLRAQLMLALYRTGRHAEALDEYQDARRRLVEELGLEPGPRLQELERQILNHDRALSGEAPGDWLSRVLPPAAPRWAGGLVVVGGVLVVAAAASVAAVELRGGDTSARIGAVAPGSVAVIDPDTNAIVASVPVGSGPSGVAVGAGGVWTTNAVDRTISRIDPESKRVMATVQLGRIPSQIAVGERAVWVASAVGSRGTVTRIDPESTSVAETTVVRVGDEGDLYAPATPSQIAVGEGAVWTNYVREQVAAFRPAADARVRTVDLGATRSADGLAVGERAVWVTSSADDTLLRIDPRTRRVVAQIPIAAARGERVAGPFGVAVGYGSVWVADALANAVTRVDPRRNKVTATIGVGRRPVRVATGEGAVWVLNAADGTVSRVDPERNVVEAMIPVGTQATAIAAGSGAVWVAVGGGRPELVAAGAPPRFGALPSTFCSDLSTKRAT